LFCPPPPIYKGKEGGACHPARPSKLGCFLQKAPPSGGTSWKAQVGLITICTPSLLNTPLPFLLIHFRNVTKLYELHNDTCFLSVMSRNLTDYVIILFLASGMLRNFTDCATMLPFDFQHVTKLYGLCNNASF